MTSAHTKRFSNLISPDAGFDGTRFRTVSHPRVLTHHSQRQPEILRAGRLRGIHLQQAVRGPTATCDDGKPYARTYTSNRLRAGIFCSLTGLAASTRITTPGKTAWAKAATTRLHSSNGCRSYAGAMDAGSCRRTLRNRPWRETRAAQKPCAVPQSRRSGQRHRAIQHRRWYYAQALASGDHAQALTAIPQGCRTR